MKAFCNLAELPVHLAIMEFLFSMEVDGEQFLHGSIRALEKLVRKSLVEAKS